MFLHYQKLHLKCYKQMYVKCMLGLCFVFYICVLHLFCTDYQYLYWDFCTVIHSYCPGLIYRYLFVCNVIILVTLPSHHTAITPHCHHTTLPSHHTAATPNCHHTTLPPRHTAITPHYLDSITYLWVLNESHKAAAGCDKVHFGRASMLCCCPSINRSRWFRSWASSWVKNSVFLCCVTTTFEHFIFWTQETTEHFMNSETGNKLQKKCKSVPVHNIHIWGDYICPFFTSATLDMK